MWGLSYPSQALANYTATKDAQQDERDAKPWYKRFGGNGWRDNILAGLGMGHAGFASIGTIILLALFASTQTGKPDEIMALTYYSAQLPAFTYWVTRRELIRHGFSHGKNETSMTTQDWMKECYIGFTFAAPGFGMGIACAYSADSKIFQKLAEYTRLGGEPSFWLLYGFTYTLGFAWLTLTPFLWKAAQSKFELNQAASNLDAREAKIADEKGITDHGSTDRSHVSGH